MEDCYRITVLLSIGENFKVCISDKCFDDSGHAIAELFARMGDLVEHAHEFGIYADNYHMCGTIDGPDLTNTFSFDF